MTILIGKPCSMILCSGTVSVFSLYKYSSIRLSLSQRGGVYMWTEEALIDELLLASSKKEAQRSALYKCFGSHLFPAHLWYFQFFFC